MGDRKLNQSKVSYKKTLKALVKKANNKDRIEYFDSETSGAKDTQCNLGLCGEEFKSMQDGTHRKNGHHCPHDGRYFSIEGDVLEGVNLPKSSTDGCFWKCLVFQRKGRKSDPHGRIIKVGNAILGSKP